jgi:diacylglycerol kinase
LNAIINGKLASTYAPQVSTAAVKAGLPAGSVPALLKAMATGVGLDKVPGINAAIEAKAVRASEWAYAHAYRLAWVSIVPFVALALIAVMCLKGVKELMTEKVEATVEHVDSQEKMAMWAARCCTCLATLSLEFGSAAQVRFGNSLELQRKLTT